MKVTMMINLTTLKIAVMVNCLLALLVAFVGFFTITTQSTTTANLQTTETVPVIATNSELIALPYVSDDSLRQEAQAQVVMYNTVNQPNIQARSSR